MKVCAICNEIVPAGQGCTRSDCPNQIQATADPAPKVDSGLTGKADRFVQPGLDRTSVFTRATVRKVAFSTIAFLAITMTIFIFPWGKIYLKLFDFRLKEVSLTGADNGREIQVYQIVTKYRNRTPDIDEIDYRIRDLPWVKDVSFTVSPPSSLSIDIDNRLYEIFMKLPPLRGEGADRNVLDLQNILSAKPQLSSRIESAEWIGNRRWDLRFETGQKLRLPEGTADAAAAFVSFADANAERNLLSSNATEFDMRVPSNLFIRTE